MWLQNACSQRAMLINQGSPEAGKGQVTGEPIAEAAPKRPTIEREPKDNQSEVGKKKEELK